MNSPEKSPSTAPIQVKVGGMSESAYGLATVEHIHREGLGDYTVLFIGPWTPDKLRQMGDFCREKGISFVMDEMVDRLTGQVTTGYQKILPQVLTTLKDYPQCCQGSLIMCEYGGLFFYWPHSTVADSATAPPAVENCAQAALNTEQQMAKTLEYARAMGIPEPYISIEACGVAASFLYRAGIHRVDLEVIYTQEMERGYAAIKGASRAFNRPAFGVDMAMVWYGGNQHDRLWEKRWRTSLFHAFIRGANPIYAEHGLMDYKALGKDYPTHHPRVQRFRQILGELATYAQEHLRPGNFPKAAVAVIHGRYDGYVGAGQTHLWGQRCNDRFLVNDADRSWDLYEELYRRRTWEDRDRYGEDDFSGNPPLGQADIIPYDAPDEVLCSYKLIIFLGRNSMDQSIYERLVRYVSQGGQLLLTAAHMDCSNNPGMEPWKPYNQGDWRELLGVTASDPATTPPKRLPYGIKFTAEPPCGWRLPLWSPNCDPKFTDGGFTMINCQHTTAQILAVASERFADYTWDNIPHNKAVLYAHQQGKGCVVLVNSLDYPGAPGLKNLYKLLLRSSCDALEVYPKVQSSDRVRYAVYQDRLYLLNTEETLQQSVVLQLSPQAAPRTITLDAGEIHEVLLP